jgi:putative colanic acid biosynthesis acetyltransferase WcaF
MVFIGVTVIALFGSAVVLLASNTPSAAVIKPGFRVKFPWKLRAGRHCWFGEDSWIDNLAPVTLGNHVCISQGVYLCTGNHDWSDSAFGLITRPICIEDGAWIAARASLGPGVMVGKCAVAGFGAVVTASIPSYEIHGGNPARFLRRREIRQDSSFEESKSSPPSRALDPKITALVQETDADDLAN